MKLKRVLTQQKAALLRKTFINTATTTIQTTCKVTDASTQKVIAILVRGVIGDELLCLAQGALLKTRTRGDAAGPATAKDLQRGEKLHGKNVLGADGRIWNHTVNSNTVGFNNNRQLSYWTRTHPQRVRDMRALFVRMLAVYQRYAPISFANQERTCKLRFMDLPISSVAINNNFRCAVHLDNNELPGTLGVMAVAGDDRVKGGSLVFPEYDVAFDVRKGDVLLFDSSLFHGNTAFNAKSCSRISVVIYGRT